jgi:hypothetical protein
MVPRRDLSCSAQCECCGYQKFQKQRKVWSFDNHRTGERIFISLSGTGDWDSYTVVAVEYFLGYDPSTGKPSRSMSRGIGRITLFRRSIEVEIFASWHSGSFTKPLPPQNLIRTWLSALISQIPESGQP